MPPTAAAVEPALLSEDEIGAALSPHPHSDSDELPPPLPETAPSRSHYFEPTLTAVQSWSRYLTHDGTFRTGWRNLDLCFPGGFDKGDMVLLTGKSHSGKSCTALNMVVNNLKRTDDWRCVWFSPDEPRELVVSKLFSIAYDRDAAATEQAIRDGDPHIQHELQRAARGLLDRVLISDQSLTFSQMLLAVDEATEYWGAPPDVCVLDYLELLPSDTADNTAVAQKAQEAKRFCKNADVVGIVLHQVGRGAAERGKPAGIAGGRYGGEAEAVAVIESYRPKEQIGLSHQERERVQDVIRLNLCKSKRPPFSLRDVEMILRPDSGRIVEPDIYDMQERGWKDEPF